MVSDSIANASVPNASKDFGKKKRANRSAKLKQCKLDARREQWLSQVKNNKGIAEEVNGGGVAVELNEPTMVTKKKAPIFKDLELKSRTMEEIHHDSDSESSSHANSPTSSCLSRVNDSGTNYTGSSSSSSSSISSSFGFSCGGSCSGNVTEEEEEGGGGDGDDGCLDDWEIMADALAASATTPNDKEGQNSGSDSPPSNETGSGLDSASDASNRGNGDLQSEGLKPEGGTGILGKGVAKGRAWRPDDASRPQCLPNLSKQRSFPANSGRISCRVVDPWVRNNVPTSCPICCEDLDLTDSSFLPCSCGFRLCLFCHKRILEEDGRCPGCRKPYAADPAQKEASVSGGSLTVRLARSCSMFSRV